VRSLPAYAALLALALSACAVPAPTPVEPTETITATLTAPAPPPSAAAVPETIAVVGDSLTQARSGESRTLDYGPESWTHDALAGFSYACGWAFGSATTATILNALDPCAADRLVVYAGTNDLLTDVPWARTAANLDAIVATVRASAVYVVAVPPLTDRGRPAVSFNARLEQHAELRGWTYVDPYAQVRAGIRYRPGMSRDGIHPTRRGARLIGEAIRATLDG
jgi:lysophospholipase L1-like esterase